MKKVFGNLLALLFIAALFLTACSEDLQPDTTMLNADQESQDIYDPRFTEGDEEDSTRGPILNP